MCKEEKWKEIPVEEARVGDEVYHCLYGEWFKVTDLSKDRIVHPISIAGVGTFTVNGRHYADHKFPTLTKARRKVRTKTVEKWGLRSQNEIDNTVHHVRFETQKEAEEHRDAFEFERSIIPCRVTWEEEE